jgi:dipeptidyl aminopeptidase/acylaminoacyl peptidase
MRFFSNFVLLLLISLFLSGTAWSQGETPLIPRKALFTDSDKDQVQLSPDGKWIGYRALSGDTMNVWVAPVGESPKARVVTKQEGAPVLNYRWTYLPGLLLYAAPAENGSHIFLLDLASKESRDLTPGKGVVAQLEKFSTDHADEALLRVKEPNRTAFDYQRVNLRTGAREVVFKNEPGYERVLFDDDWRPRVAMSRKKDGGHELLQPNGAGEWTSFASFSDGMEAKASQPILLDKAGKTLYLTDNRGRDKAALQSIDLASGKVTLLVEDPFADLLPALLTHPKTGRVQSVSTYYGRMRRHFLDPTIIPDFEYLRTVQRGDIGLLAPYGGRSLDDRVWLVVFLDGGPTRYYVYDRTVRRATFLFTDNQALDAYALGRRHLEVITTRDGMEFPADLYLPKTADPDGNGRPRRPVPLLIYVHGGPWVAYPWNDWFTNRSLQLLADRGYAALRIEFRGANGFGRKVEDASVREWGAKMQDDLIDAADWAIKQGITARERIGVWGWSYGGYATLAALATTDRFACGLSMYGPTDLDLLIAEGSPSAQIAWRKMIGDNTTEDGRALLKKASPIHYAESFAKPVLVTQGGKDKIVHQNQADRFVDELQKRKKPVTYLLYPDEPHDFRRRESWISFFAIAEAFFHDHLGGRYEPIGDDLRGSSLDVRAGGELIPGLSEAMSQTSPATNRKSGL